MQTPASSSTTLGQAPARVLMGRYGVAIGAVVLASGLAIFGQQSVEHSQGDLLLLCLAAVTISAWYGGVGPGLLATLLAIIISDHVLPAAMSGVLQTPVNPMRPSLFASVAILISALSQAKKHAEADLQRSLDTLERRVKSRTEELSAANVALSAQIVERETAEEAYRELFENASDMVYTMDLAGAFTTLNKVGQEMTGYAPEEVRRLSFADLVADGDRLAVQETTAQIVGGRRAKTLSIQLVRKDGGRVEVEVTMRLIFRDGRPVGLQGIARDLSERQRLESDLRQAQKLEAIGHLAGGVAHDFNNILMVIQGYSDMLLVEPGVNEGHRSDLREIQAAARRGSDLTRQLLAFGRKQVLRIMPLDLNEVLLDMSQMLSRLIGENIRLQLRPSPDPCPIEADRVQLEQVLMNLAVNARDAMSRGGTLSIAIDRVDLNGHAPDLARGPHVRLVVRDTGCGMDPVTRERIFEPFFTTKGPGKGSGLGLSTVYGVVKQLGGLVRVESTPLQGTTFTVHFPATAKAVEAAREPVVAGLVAVGVETVLLVEDDRPVRAVVLSMLRRHGYTVVEADGPREALRLAKTYKGAIDLVLSDVIMPEMSGPEMVALLKTVRPDPQVVYLSGYATERLVRDGLLREGVRLVQKPASAPELLHAVRTALDRTTRVGIRVAS